MSAKHTPGPWIFTGPHDDEFGDPEYVIYGDDGDEVIGSGITQSDSRLMAAAPDLLEALEGMVRGAEAMGWDSAIKARAAIAKARGE